MIKYNAYKLYLFILIAINVGKKAKNKLNFLILKLSRIFRSCRLFLRGVHRSAAL